MYFLMGLWYSRWRAPLLVLLAALLAAPVLLLQRDANTPGPSTPATSAPTTTLPVEITWSFAPLADEIKFPAGVAHPAYPTKVAEESVTALANALGLDGVERSGAFWSGGGLSVSPDGAWSYENPDAVDPAAGTGCRPGSVCTDPSGSLPPAVQDLPAVEVAISRAEEILSAGGLQTAVLSARRDQWRAVVETYLLSDGVAVGVFGRVVFGAGGVILHASGTVSGFFVDFSAARSVPSAEEGLSRLPKNAVRLFEGSRTPQRGETVRVVNVVRTAHRFEPDGNPFPILAYEDEYGNVWGLAEKNPPVSAG